MLNIDKNPLYRCFILYIFPPPFPDVKITPTPAYLENSHHPFAVPKLTLSSSQYYSQTETNLCQISSHVPQFLPCYFCCSSGLGAISGLFSLRFTAQCRIMALCAFNQQQQCSTCRTWISLTFRSVTSSVAYPHHKHALLFF